MKSLLIVESPSKAKTISKYIGGGYEVVACVGHVKDLPKKDLGIDIENDFNMTLQVLPDRKSFIRELKSKAKKANEVIIATDPDREGEAIADHLASEIPKAKLKRVQFTEITKQGVLDGMNHPHSIDDNMVSAQKTRRIIDRLVGYKISPLLWNTLQKNMKFVKTALSAGRVQSAAVKIIVDRDRERAVFRHAEYFDLTASLATQTNEMFQSRLFTLDGEKLARGSDFDKTTGELKTSNRVLLNKKDADALAEKLLKGDWVVNDIEEKPQTSRPRPPFTTSTLQQEAGRKLRYPAKKTMRMAQQLYEAGYITYMRTDSTHLSAEALNAARTDIQNLYGDKYLPKKPNFYATKVKNAQEAHEAIRPAGTRFTPMETVSASLGKDAARLYDLIWKRTMASQMLPAKLMQTIVYVTNQNSIFRSRGKVILFPGYMRAYVEGTDDPNAKLASAEVMLPALKQQDELSCKSLDVAEHQTKPPARFTEASLVKELEAQGIGRPSTYASIIDTIQYRDYVKVTKGKLVPTYIAVAVTQLLENHFTSLVDAKFTAKMEDNLDDISRGELKALPFMNAFYFGSKKQVGLDKMLNEEIDISKACTIPTYDESVDGRVGRFGPYLRKDDKTAAIPMSVAPGDLTPEKIQELLNKPDQKDASLGTDQATGEPIYLKEGPYGYYVQLGEGKKRKSLTKGTSPEDVTLEMAVSLLSLPKTLGKHPESGEDVIADLGRYGPYVKCGKTNAKLLPPLTPITVTLDEALSALAKRRQGSVELKSVGEHPKTGEAIVIKEGRYGPYATDGKVNASIPKESDPQTITLEEVVILIDKRRANPPKKRRRKKK